MSTKMGRTTEPKKRDTNKRAETNTTNKTGKARAFTQKQFDAMADVPWDGEQHVFRASDDDDRAKKRLCQVCKFNDENYFIDKDTNNESHTQRRMQFKCLYCNLNLCIQCHPLIAAHRAPKL